MYNAVPVVLTVTQLNSYIKSIIDSDTNLNLVFMSGEISNFTNHYRTGHMYFTIKDDNCAVKAVMFKGNAFRLKFMPQDGMKVIVRGRVSVFEATGQYQFYVDDMQPDGIGALNLAYEQLKEKLLNEGLFDENNKKPIPKYPQRVGIITSPTGAAVQDLLNILKRRCKMAEIVFVPAQVQGDNSVEQLVSAVKLLNKNKCVDVIIIGRGGGSIEDLWSFNSESLAREIFNSSIPVISAVGHETDFTICDFVSDLRAPTPSAAAELAVPDCNQEKIYLSSLQNELYSCVLSSIKTKKEKLNYLTTKQCFVNPCESINIKRLTLDKHYKDLINFEKSNLEKSRLQFSSLVSNLNAMSPLNVLSRGYSAVFSAENIVNSINKIKVNDELTIKFADGSAICNVKEIMANGNDI